MASAQRVARADSEGSAAGASLLGPPLKILRPKSFDIVFVLDAGELSQIADCIRGAALALQSDIARSTRKPGDGPTVGDRPRPRKLVRLGFVLHCGGGSSSAPTVRQLDLTPHWRVVRTFLEENATAGKSDGVWPAAELASALRRARVGSSWDAKSVTKTAVVIGRAAPPADTQSTCRAEVAALRAAGVRLVSVHCPDEFYASSGIGRVGTAPPAAAPAFYSELASLGGCSAACLSLPRPEAAPQLVAGLCLLAVSRSSFQDWRAAGGGTDAPPRDELLSQLEVLDVKGRAGSAPGPPRRAGPGGGCAYASGTSDFRVPRDGLSAAAPHLLAVQQRRSSVGDAQSRARAVAGGFGTSRSNPV